MNSDLPKVLHPLGGAPLFAHALAAGAVLAPEQTVLVVGKDADDVTRTAQQIAPDVTIAVQAEQRGTGHAVLQAAGALAGFDGDVAVLYGDTPFISAETLRRMQTARRAGSSIVVLGFQADVPGQYGRLVMDGKQLKRIVEFKDATARERDITLCNSGVIYGDATLILDLCSRLENNNANGEYYLTDIVAMANERGHPVTAITCAQDETLGINTRAELAAAETVLQARMREDALENGVTLIAPDTVFFSTDTQIGRDCVIEPNVVFGPGVTVETGATIRAFCHLEGCHVGHGAIVGPYARLRPGAELMNDAKVGNFVEIKNATLGEGAKVNHLSYIGDADVGASANIGAGTVTCNYNGFEKFRTEIGAGAFIGSDTMLVAPVKVGDGAMTASGSVITRDVPDDALAFGRAQQVNKTGAARRLFDLYKSARNKRRKVV